MATQLTREIATMATNVRSITNQNLAMQEVLIQMQDQGGHPILPYAPAEPYPQEDEEQSQMASSSRRAKRISPIERKVRIDISSNYDSSRPNEAPFGIKDNFPPKYEHNLGPKDRALYLIELDL